MIIIADSSCDIWTLPDVAFASVPLDIYTDERRFVDDETLDVSEMLEYLKGFKGRSYTSCPSSQRWIDAFDGEDEVYIVTLTSGLSGTYNSAEIAREMYLETHPDAKVLVVDSLSTSSEMNLIIQKIRELKLQGMEFDEVCREIAAYQKRTRLFFAFESLHNFAQNGRVPKILEQAVGFLGLTVLGTADEEGHVKPTGKGRGCKKVVSSLLSQMKAAGYAGGKVVITHVKNEKLAKAFSEKLLEAYPGAEVEIYPSRGLVAYYAEEHGIIVGCEC